MRNLKKYVMAHLRREALVAFKHLHRTRQAVFIGDQHALKQSRLKINESFRKNMHEKEPNKISQMIYLARCVERQLRTNVIQAVQEKPGIFTLRMTPQTTLLDNVPFDPYFKEDERSPMRRKKQRPALPQNYKCYCQTLLKDS